ncbi:MAG: hypothetical protein QM655_07555 [Nocardioidaceae bacterium]
MTEIRSGYLVTGLVFLGIATVWWLRDQDVIGTDGLTWLLPAVLFGSGLAGLIASLAKGVSGRSRTEPELATESTVEHSSEVTDVPDAVEGDQP